nr:MAG TPA: hypothetical protein [Caudoviricetes sp.]
MRSPTTAAWVRTLFCAGYYIINLTKTFRLVKFCCHGFLVYSGGKVIFALMINQTC